MVMEEQIAQSVLSAVMQGATLILRISERAAKLLGSATSTTVTAVGKTTKDTLRQGRESVVKLTKKSGGDLHFTEQLSREDMRTARTQLHHYGVHYGIEKNADTGKYYLVFKGSDADMVKHALERTLAKVDGKVAIDPVVVPEQAQGVNQTAQDVAVTKASDLVPATLPSDAPRFTMQFSTVQWDRDAKIISDNFTKLGIPYTMSDGENGVKQVAFPQSCQPAVKQFIDSYAENVKHFNTNRVLNYDQLTPAQPTQAPSVQQPVHTQTRVSSKATPKKKTASDVRRELKQDTQERINRSRGAAPVHTVSKAKTR
ncbi:MAG: PcfB family protein [Bifidobacterium crudilactis]|uniref:DUF3801 domain-containing protein n=1 Tax=Bifidobacterium TaxID=1678 RepID=UPI0026498D8D|nr:DUF3801 domain-containing protein [Bifidobacterium crudilactis]MDN5973352.1 PcfB family protein [Bifidobacterium crudilactis]MDN6587624.1 PcfB family protein [Bifidobacterium crudilactis]